MLKISQTGWAPGSVWSVEQHLTQSTKTWRPKKLLSSPSIFSWWKKPKELFFLSIHLCVLWGIFCPHIVKRDDSFSIPGASAARVGKTTRRHYTKLNLFKLSTIFFLPFFLFFVLNRGGNREEKRVVWVQAAAFWKSSHTKAFFLPSLCPPDRSLLRIPQRRATLRA